MGIDLKHEDENGHQLAELSDPQSLVAWFLPQSGMQDSHCLRYIDHYGNTVFNQLQIPQLIAELEKLPTHPHKPEADQHLEAVLEFIRKTQDETHTYIKFYGD